MAQAKKRITEYQAVVLFNQHIVDSAVRLWPAIYEKLLSFSNGKFRINDKKQASFELALAAMALDLQAVKNLFPKEQARRIEGWVYKSGHSEKFGDYARNEIVRYSQQFQKEIDRIGIGSDPLNIVPAFLLHRWLGDRLRNFEVEIHGKKTGIIDPLLVAAVTETLFAPPFVGTWKRINEEYELTQGEPQSASDLEAQSPKNDDSQPKNGQIKIDPSDAAAFKLRGGAKSDKGSIAKLKMIVGLGAWGLVIAVWALGTLRGAIVGHWSNIFSVIAAFGAIVFVFRVCVAVVSRKIKETAVDMGHERASWSLLAMIVPISAIFYLAAYTSPSVPWLDMLASAITNLGYTFGIAALASKRFDFEILGLHSRASKLWAAIVFFVAGTVLLNRDLFIGL